MAPDKLLYCHSLPVCALVCLVISAIIFTIDMMIPLGVAGGVPYILVILVSLKSESIKFTIYSAIFCSLLTILGYFLSPEGGEHWKVIMNRALALFAIWVTALLSIKIIQETKKELKTLQGLLPICSSCKKIRDDEGYWNQIESYIHSHSEAKFSHGICPECLKAIYPEYEYSKNKNSDKPT